MTDLADDITMEILWQYLPIEDIINYCRINRSIRSICSNKETWIFLLWRDFRNKNYSSNPRDDYLHLFNQRTTNIFSDWLEIKNLIALREMARFYNISNIYNLSRQEIISQILSLATLNEMLAFLNKRIVLF